MRRFRAMLIVVTILSGFTILAVFLWASQGSLLQTLFGPGRVEFVRLEAVERSSRPNDYLIAPEGFGTAVPDEISPVFEVSASQLEEVWLKIMAGQPRTSRMPTSPADEQLEFEQRSRVFGFPDLISVHFIALSVDRSSLAIYSRSRYGSSDLGVNRRRVRALLKLLHEELKDH